MSKITEIKSVKWKSAGTDNHIGDSRKMNQVIKRAAKAKLTAKPRKKPHEEELLLEIEIYKKEMLCEFRMRRDVTNRLIEAERILLELCSSEGKVVGKNKRVMGYWEKYGAK